MTTLLETYRAKANVKKARAAQLSAIVEALGGVENGWRGFGFAEEVVSYLRENDTAYADLRDVGDLVERLGITDKLGGFDAATLEAAREAERSDLRRIDEVIEQKRALRGSDWE